jgi:hypothetical protein
VRAERSVRSTESKPRIDTKNALPLPIVEEGTWSRERKTSGTAVSNDPLPGRVAFQVDLPPRSRVCNELHDAPEALGYRGEWLYPVRDIALFKGSPRRPGCARIGVLSKDHGVHIVGLDPIEGTEDVRVSTRTSGWPAAPPGYDLFSLFEGQRPAICSRAGSTPLSTPCQPTSTSSRQPLRKLRIAGRRLAIRLTSLYGARRS